jgi:hypothetical protein
MDKGRVAALDAGRALAIVGVVAVHLSFQFPNLPGAVTLIARMGQYGVQLFFVISAITIFMTLEMDHARCADARHVTLRFYIKRFFRRARASSVHGFSVRMARWTCCSTCSFCMRFRRPQSITSCLEDGRSVSKCCST